MDGPKSIVNVSGDCYDHVDVSSDGIWNEKHGESIFQHALVRLHVQLLVVFFLINCFHLVLKRFHFSRFTSEFLAGVVLGPTLMGKYFGSATNFLFPDPNQVFASLSKIGYIFFLFFAGVRMDPSLIRKTGKTPFILGILMFLTSFVMPLLLQYDYPKDANRAVGSRLANRVFNEIYFTTIVQTRFVAVSCLLMQLKILNSELGRLAMASSLVTEFLLIITVAVHGFRGALATSKPVGVEAIFLSFAFTMFIVILLRQMTLGFIRKTPEGTTTKEVYATITMAVMFLLASSGEMVGMNYLYGPLIFGLVVPARSPLAEVLVTKFDTIASGFLLPIMTSFCASKFDLWKFIYQFDIALPLKISLIGFSIKILITFVAVKCCGIPWRHTAVVTIILSAKGLYEVGMFLSFTNIKVNDGFFLIFLIQAFQPLMVKKLYDPTEHYVGYKKKSITDTSDDAELRILVCAHRQGDAMVAIKLLEYLDPTKQSPLSIYGLCLEELISSFTPLLINHQLGQKNTTSEGFARSKHIIDIFKYFESRHMKLAQVNVFTAVSPVKQMHQDICWLSYEKACSIIILPFHKKWNNKGKVVSDNNELRDLNIDVLERAPCSVGILIDRHGTCNGLSSVFNIVSSTLYRVAIVFVGGPDDREALAYALRMARSPRVQLTVVRLISQEEYDHHRWEIMRDNECLRSMRLDVSERSKINYVEESVRDGSDTSSVVQSMLRNHDLIIIGRRHETEPEALSGLSEWSVFRELGPIGDLLASQHITSPISALVVQQQMTKASLSNSA